MGNPTDELRAKLDELGVEHKDNDYNFYRTTQLDCGCVTAKFQEWRSGNRTFDAKNITPEQAIAATVGEECEMRICKRCGVAYELNIIDKGFGKPRFCPNCGYREMCQ